MLFEDEADAVARMDDGVPLRLLHHLAGSDTPERGQVIKPELGDAVGNRLRTGLHERHTLLPYFWEFFHVGHVALQPPVAEHLPAHVGAALETGSELEAGRCG